MTNDQNAIANIQENMIAWHYIAQLLYCEKFMDVFKECVNKDPKYIEELIRVIISGIVQSFLAYKDLVTNWANLNMHTPSKGI